jgi:beta-phosphoglucomutase-like phosphatase (HAD superfamily)
MRPGLRDDVQGCLFDPAAWKEMFDSFLQGWAAPHHQPFRAFDQHDDYDRDVEGKPRLDGVRDFLASRGIHLPEGAPDDPATANTVTGLGRRCRRIHQDGADAYPGPVACVRAARDAGLSGAVVSSSNDCRDVLSAAHILELFQEVFDGAVVEAGRAGAFGCVIGVHCVGQAQALREHSADRMVGDGVELVDGGGRP